ncbi:hypothetical protein CGRA01v4_10391 [Colletotrichum graminicola]|nr:hypothetical protein CGRA01v4_10391 [Colletotrichum graminicola]
MTALLYPRLSRSDAASDHGSGVLG